MYDMLLMGCGDCLHQQDPAAKVPSLAAAGTQQLLTPALPNLDLR